MGHVRETLLEVARRQMLSRGFAATTIDDICAGARVTKGAFFHYFRTKDDLGRAVLQHHCQAVGRAYAGADFAASADPLQRLHGYIDLTIELCRDPIRDGCLVGAFAQELSDTHPAIRADCCQAFEQWTQGLRAMLDDVARRYRPREPVDTRSLADHFIAVFEGALVLGRVRGDAAAVRQSLDHFRRYVTSLFAAAKEKGS
jgi:TetR/AcrR family transcriptional repressor of nem operon